MGVVHGPAGIGAAQVLGVAAEQPRATKRRRDVAQAKAIALLATNYLGLEFKARDLSALPVELSLVATDLVAAAQEDRASC